MNEEKFSKLKIYFKELLPTMTEESWLITKNILGVRSFKKGEFIIREGDVCDHVSFINYGLVRMFHYVNGKEKSTCFANENTAFNTNLY